MKEKSKKSCKGCNPPWEAPQVIPAQLRRVNNLIARKINQFSRENEVEEVTPMHGWIMAYLYHRRTEPVFKDQFERVLPATSVANLYPFNYSGKTDAHGFYIGRDKFGSNVLVDFNQRADDKTNGSILILGNSGQGKSYLLKLILCNLRESSMNVICLDPEMEVRQEVA